MRASLSEVQAINFELPAELRVTYFPDPMSEETERILFFEGLFKFVAEWRFETDGSLAQRRALALTGAAVALLTLMPAYVLFLFGFIFALLSAAAITLILFFVASLPLGFFEFGGVVLMGILRQYVYVFALSLLISILAGLLIAVGIETFLPSGALDLKSMLVYLATLFIVAIGLQAIVRMAWAAMTGSFGLFGQSITSLSQMAAVGAVSTEGGGMLSSAAKVATGVALGAATGGASVALLAGAGSLFSSTRAGAGLASLAVAAGSESKGAKVFAETARARGVSGVASGVMASRAFDTARKSKQARGRRWVRTDAEAPKLLAIDTLDPESPNLVVGDMPAQYRLRDMGWSQGQLETLFGTVRSQLRLGMLDEQQAVSDLQASNSFEDAPSADLRRAVQLATLVTSDVRPTRSASADRKGSVL